MSDRRYTTLVFFTDGFPCGAESERVFVMPEIEAAARRFERVIVVPTFVLSRCGEDVTLPENVEVDTAWADSAVARNRWLRLPSAVLPTTWWRVRGDISRSGVSFSVMAGAMARFLKKWCRCRGLNECDTLFYTFWFDIAAAALTVAGIDYVSSAHGFDIYTSRGGVLRRGMLQRVRRLYAASDSGAAHIRNVFPAYADKVCSRRLGCVKLFADVLTRRHLPSDKKITVLSVSNVVPGKRVRLNAELMAALAVARPSTAVRWVHVGDGDSMSELCQWLEAERLPENFSWELRGALENDAVHRIYRDETVDWFMLLSEREGGNAIAACEAMAYGVPVIATDTTGLAELVDDECGVLLPVDVTPEAFVRGMVPYLDSTLRFDALRRGAACRWTDSFDASRLRGDFFDELLHCPE